jgi:hypothetical protein
LGRNFQILLAVTLGCEVLGGHAELLAEHQRHRFLLSSSVIIRPLQGQPPTIDLVMGYSRSNTSPLLKRFLARSNELVKKVAQTVRLPAGDEGVHG